MARLKYTDLNLYARLLRQARPYWPHIAALVLLSFLSTPIALLMPLPLAIIVDSVAGSNPIPEFLADILPKISTASASGVLVFAVSLLVAISLLDQLQKLGSAVLGTYTGEKLILSFRALLFRHVQRLSLSYHDSKGTADSIYRIYWDGVSIQWVSISGVTPFISASFMLIGMIYVTARIDWQLALIALAVFPILFLVTSASSRRLRSGWEKTKDLESATHTLVQEVLTGLRLVKAFGQEDREHVRFVTRSGESTRERIRLALIDGVFGALFGLTIAVGMALVLLIGTRHVQAGHLKLGELVLIMGYLAQLYSPVQVISKSFMSMQSALASAERGFKLLDEVPDIIEKPHALPLARASGAVAFRNVSFTYDGSGIVLDNVSFEIPTGTRLGVVGATGAGKTTLVSLLSRFYDPTAGQILLDGADLRDYKLADLRNQFSIVLQEPVLFSTTVAENIAYARPEATEAQIIEAAKAANAHDFIVNLPAGYQSVVGERGMRLSGGERQRIALARAFLKDAPILILDEPTSSVDVKTEAAIMQAMERLMRGRTTVLISHRPTIVADCDAFVEIHTGRVSGRTSPKAPGSFDAA
jgi:ATP-binding cassette, subfamily B, bacterial